jgi:hypothetical protein
VAEDGELCIAGARWLKTGRKIERCIAGARCPVGDSVMVGTRWAPCGVVYAWGSSPRTADKGPLGSTKKSQVRKSK